MFELAIIVAVITGVGQVVKQFVPAKFMPIVSLVLGIAAGLGFLDASLKEQIFIGLAMGLAASGLFDLATLPSKK
jgi:uncharacterized spore protein YtfJ